MKRLLLLAILLHSFCHAQQDSLASEHKATDREARLANRAMVFKLEVAVPIVGNPYWDEYDNTSQDDDESNPWFLPAGLNVKVGAGIRLTRFFILGAVSGLESRLDHKLVVAPVLGDLTVLIPVPDGSHLLANAGIGRVFALGRDGLSGDYRRIGIGFGNSNGAALLELSQYGLAYKGKTALTNFSVGFIAKF